jgi:hypothetical protein
MKLHTAGALCTSALFVTIFQAIAQDAPALPPVLRIIREEIKQGKDVAHEKTEASFARMLAKNKYPAYSLGCTVVAGPSEAWFFEAHDSFMSIQKTQNLMEKNAALRTDFTNLDSMDAELRINSTTMIAVLRPDISYRVSEFAQELPKTRYFSMSILRIRPFTDMRLTELGKQVIAADEKANIDVAVAVYQVVSGGPSGMYLLFTPMKSLETMDGAPARSKAMMASMGMDKAAALYKNGGEVISGTQTFLLAINPRMSYVSKEISDGDPEFWKPKPAAVNTKPGASKTVEKSGAGQ